MIVATVIVIYNGMQRNWIQRCFDSLLASELPTEIIAIDNASKDGSVPFIQENYPTVKLFESGENLGFGGANNLGIKHAVEAGADYVFLLNQDARIEPDVLPKLVHGFSISTGYGIISPLHLNGRGDALDLSFSKSIAPHLCAGLYSDFVLGQPQDKVYEAEFICAAAWLISKECLEKVGGFSPTFFHYSEDDNYIHRLHYKGLKIGVYPFAKIMHDREERETDRVFDRRDYQDNNRNLLISSDPNAKTGVADILNHLKIIHLKSLLKGNFNEAKRIKKQKQQLKEQEELINSNRQKSIAGNWAFINSMDIK